MAVILSRPQWVKFMNTFCENALSWMLQHTFDHVDDKSIVFQVNFVFSNGLVPSGITSDVTLAALTGSIKLVVPYHLVKPLQLIWRLGYL